MYCCQPEAYLCGEGVSGWKVQISLSSISHSLPEAGDARRGNSWLRGSTRSCQSAPVVETRAKYRFRPRSPHRRTVWIERSSCWIRRQFHPDWTNWAGAEEQGERRRNGGDMGADVTPKCQLRAVRRHKCHRAVTPTSRCGWIYQLRCWHHH